MKVHPTSLNLCHNLIDCIENEPMLHWYIGQRIVSAIIINNEIKAPTHGYQNCDTSQRLIFGGHVKLRKSFCTRVNIWVSTILNHINTGMVLPRYEGSCMVYRPECYQEQNYRQVQIPYLYRKM